jgi:hypothetical protein
LVRLAHRCRGPLLVLARGLGYGDVLSLSFSLQGDTNSLESRACRFASIAAGGMGKRIRA